MRTRAAINLEKSDARLGVHESVAHYEERQDLKYPHDNEELH